MSDYLMHYGTKMHSGRYPWGSGENPYQRLGLGSLTARVKELEDQGMTQTEIAKDLGMTTTILRQRLSAEKADMKLAKYYEAQKLIDKGYSNVKVAEMLGITEGTVRNWRKDGQEAKISRLRGVANELDKQVQEKRFIDVGEGANYALNCTDSRLKAACTLLCDEKGYEYHELRVQQLGTNHKTTYVVLCEPGTDKRYLYEHLDEIHEIDESKLIKTDGSVQLGEFKPQSVDRSRILVRYGDEGGADKDGTIELRRGVDDISLGNAHYAQVRIAVDDKMYMKGMAFYSDDIPPGYDIIYNSNKPKGSGDDKVFKELKLNDANPFGATIKGQDDPSELKLCQKEYIDKNGNTKISAINVVNEEGTWGGSDQYKGWKNSLSSQFLSKQPVPLIKRQLDLAYTQEKSKLDDILKITEPTVKRKMLEEFADGCDAAAVELKAAALPRQRTHVILPLTTIKDNEVYAPNYNNGEHVILVRHPHGGTFEIPQLVVNNDLPEGKKVVGSMAPDAIGISQKTAQKLSGADFDGDSVIVIPSDNVRFKITDAHTHPALKELENFDPGKYALPDTKDENGEYVYKAITNKNKQTEMGKVSNLITDMTIKGAPYEDIVRAVKHSMVVIDAEKHRYDYKQSETDQGIYELKKLYQGVNDKGQVKGASTIVSRASAKYVDNEQKEFYYSKPRYKDGKLVGGINPETGEKVIQYTNREYNDDKKVKDPVTGEVTWEPKYDKKTGERKTKKATTDTTRMAATNDPYTLTSDGKGGYPIEEAYAAHATRMKALGNQARKEWLAVEDRKYDPSAAKTYAKEVDSVMSKLLVAQKNAPRERQAILLGNSSIKAQIAADPTLKDDKDRLKKKKGQALSAARARTGAKKERITFTDKEWEAVQSGAFRPTTLKKIIDNAKTDEVEQRAMPKANLSITKTKASTIKAMLANGYSQSEVAAALGISTSTVNKVANM